MNDKLRPQNPIVIYHGNCRDGFCAAWVAWLWFKSYWAQWQIVPEFWSAQYSEGALPHIVDRDVFMLDFSYNRLVMERMYQDARQFHVLDHHKTAWEAMKDADLGPSVHYDMERSGAGMAWDYFFNKPRPWLVDYVEDRDLWKYALPDSRIVNAFISTLAFDFSAWDEIHARYSGPQTLSVLAAGQAVLDKVATYVREVIKDARHVTFEGRWVPIVNAPYTDISEVLHELCKTPQDLDGIDRELPPFAIGWRQCNNGRFHYDLRSVGDFDVSVLAKKHGGGGHLNAAGFEADTPVHLWW